MYRETAEKAESWFWYLIIPKIKKIPKRNFLMTLKKRKIC